MATVPIVTEVTKAQLDALVAANGLNEGLQYKVTDLGYIALATGDNSYIIIGAIPYMKWVGNIALNAQFEIVEYPLENDFPDVHWQKLGTGYYYLALPASELDKIYLQNNLIFFDAYGNFDGQIVTAEVKEENNEKGVAIFVSGADGQGTDYWPLLIIPVEVRLYY